MLQKIFAVSYRRNTCMKKKVLFFGKLFIVTLLLFVFCFGVVMPQYTGNYQASMVDKAARLRSVEGPKIVLIGNSNLAFGMDSQMLEEAFSMPVVNMGLHGGVGNVFNEQAARLNVTPGDIYVVCHSNYDDTDAIKNPELAWITIENHFELYKLIRPKDWWDMIRAYPTYLRKCLGQWRNESGNQETNDCYRRSAFNAYGDIYYPRPQSEEGIDFSPVAIHHINETTAKRLNTLYDDLQKQGADMVVAGYPIVEYEGTPERAAYDEMGQEIADALDAAVISDFNDYRYPTSYFYNTYMHLTDEGTKARTQQLIKDLQAYMDGEAKYENK